MEGGPVTWKVDQSSLLTACSDVHLPLRCTLTLDVNRQAVYRKLKLEDTEAVAKALNDRPNFGAGKMRGDLMY